MTHIQDATIAVIDIDTQAIREIGTGRMPSALAANTETGEIYVANYEDGSVTVIDGRTNAVTATVKIDGHPQALAVDADESLLYVANTQQNSVSVIDLHTISSATL